MVLPEVGDRIGVHPDRLSLQSKTGRAGMVYWQSQYVCLFSIDDEQVRLHEFSDRLQGT